MALPKYDKYLYENHKYKTYEQMAEECNASIDTIYNRCNKLRIKAMKKKRLVTDFTDIDKVIMDNIHLQYKDIAAMLGIKTHTVNNRIATMGWGKPKVEKEIINNSPNFNVHQHDNWLI